MSRWRRFALAGALVGSFVAGASSQRLLSFPFGPAERLAQAINRRLRPDKGFRDVSGRREVPCQRFADEGTAVLLTLGQSNAANEGALGEQPGEGVFNFNFFDGRCYVARDPLLGTTGLGGSPWSRLGELLVSRGAYRQVLIVPIAVGGSPIERWARGGRQHHRIAAAQEGLAAAGLAPTHVLWHQGESDARHTSEEQYVARFGSMLDGLRDAGIDAPVYVAVASICGHAGSDLIRTAQRTIPRRFANVFPGPDSDSLSGPRWRRDGCHFSEEGLERHAELWFEVLTADRE